MASKERIGSATGEEIADRVARGDISNDWTAADALSQADVERLADEEDGPLPVGWEKTVIIGLPPGKDAIKLRIDRDVLHWFRGSGKGYQTRMNNVLRAFMKSQEFSR